MPFDETTLDDPGVARCEIRRHAELLLQFDHIVGDMVVHDEPAIGQVRDPRLAASAVGIAVYIDMLRFRCVRSARQ